MARSGGKLAACQQEMNAIIKSLESLSASIRCGFQNVGQDKCADSIDLVISNLKYARKSLNSIQPSMLNKLQQAAEEAETKICK